MNEERIELDWTFALQWLVLIAIGVAAAGTVAVVSVWPVGETVENVLGEAASVLAAGSMFGGILGLGVGLSQGALLRRWGINAGRWTVATVAAGALGMAIAFSLVLSLGSLEAVPESLTGLVMGLSLGLSFGIGQSLVLRRHGLQAGGWFIVNILATVVALVVALPLGGEGRELLSVGVMGLLFAAGTGLGTMWLPRQETAVAR